MIQPSYGCRSYIQRRLDAVILDCWDIFTRLEWSNRNYFNTMKIRIIFIAYIDTIYNHHTKRWNCHYQLGSETMNHPSINIDTSNARSAIKQHLIIKIYFNQNAADLTISNVDLSDSGIQICDQLLAESEAPINWQKRSLHHVWTIS